MFESFIDFLLKSGVNEENLVEVTNEKINWSTTSRVKKGWGKDSYLEMK